MPTAPGAPPPRHGPPQPGQRVGPFLLLRELGRGAMGVVFEARHVDLGREVALKLRLAPAGVDERDERRFLVEAQAAARLRHPGIVAVHEVGRDEAGRAWIAMDLVEGAPLDAALRRGPLPVERAARLALGIARALEHAHAHGVLHRDLKPANVLVRPDDAPLVMDFGLARLTEGADALTRTGELLGTPAYMAPEQADGQRVDARADVWSLGATLYHLLTGAPPFEGASVIMVLHAALTAPVPSPRARRPEVPPALEAIVLRCLARPPEQRYPSAAAVAADLERFLRGDAPADAGRAPCRGRRTAALGALAGLAALTLAWLLTRAPPPRAEPGPPPPPPEPAREQAPTSAGPRWRRLAPAQAPPARCNHAMTYDPRRGVVVLFGGHGHGRGHDDLWSWDGAAWREEAVDVRPPPRYSPAMAYDEVNGRLVLHGGKVVGGTGEGLADLWEFDGERWQQRLDGGSALALAGHGAVHVPGLPGVVFLGGAPFKLQVVSNVWRWSGDGVVPVENEGTPPTGRRLFGAAWDPTRQGVAVVGAGERGGDEHWGWSPTDGWRQHATLPMGLRRGPSLLWTHRGLLVLCGGRPVGDDAWLRQDERWTELEVPERPPARRWQAAAYDPRREVVVLFGGQESSGEWLDDTWELDLGE
ncbi:MAG: serine/threonine protein kinase [Planctomycetes bacterium]|nr:serine/threonine protein kinase [Planctomycetota bacterium]